MPDLWPETFEPVPVTLPLSILREQAELLERKTQGVLKGSVASTQSEGRFYHNFYVMAPSLNSHGYGYQLLSVEYPMELYPLKVFASPAEQWYTCYTEEQFVQTLRKILNDDKTTTIISAIRAQALAMNP